MLKDSAGLKRVFQTAYKLYEKDLELSYHPFLPILARASSLPTAICGRRAHAREALILSTHGQVRCRGSRQGVGTLPLELPAGQAQGCRPLHFAAATCQADCCAPSGRQCARRSLARARARHTVEWTKAQHGHGVDRVPPPLHLPRRRLALQAAPATHHFSHASHPAFHAAQTQRTLMGPALRVDVLDDIIAIAKGAVDRLCVKLETFRGTGREVDIEEEFRLLTLQVGPERWGRLWRSLGG